ncbi:3'(2'),5'-bisphosphate nucleotidase CysQ [Tenacibaculum sp. Bg11-29]|uniref:3'(2'),5'-bisphosphate nucleotidase CysQ n=1 Tax=Tenacibaculum sp. Bg11-29 TaxID=2058306 RepID=UPI001E391BD1|nr:3'(2'),5'-bisphosphate nucleotidase CysQ [Tenacibaculum sp. Bg11-29]
MNKNLLINNNLMVAIKASIYAGHEILKVYNEKFNYELKDDLSPLTAADKNANDVINKYLETTNIPIISEENTQIDYEVRKKWKQCWIVDPLDGTKEFIKRNGEFTVNIALIDNGKPIIGVIYIPVEEKLYYADVEKGKAYVIDINKESISDDFLFNESVLIKKRDKIEKEKIKVVGSRSHMNDETLTFIDNLRAKRFKVEVVSKGSSLKFCLVVEDKADIYPRFAPTMEWDTAAAHAICNASGVSIIGEDTKEELTYNKKNLLNPWFICK